jgi:hypothetical protein
VEKDISVSSPSIDASILDVKVSLLSVNVTLAPPIPVPNASLSFF